MKGHAYVKTPHTLLNFHVLYYKGEELNKLIISEEEFIARNWESEIKPKYGFLSWILNNKQQMCLIFMKNFQILIFLNTIFLFFSFNT